jgi:iron(III) transport system substrate-binding protein
MILALLAFAIILPSCRSGTSDSRRLLVYTPHGQDLLKDFIARYKVINPNTEVQFLDMGSREILERVRVERNRPQADIWWGASHTTFQTAAEEDLLAEFRPSWADKVPATARERRR